MDKTKGWLALAEEDLLWAKASRKIKFKSQSTPGNKGLVPQQLVLLRE